MPEGKAEGLKSFSTLNENKVDVESPIKEEECLDGFLSLLFVRRLDVPESTRYGGGRARDKDLQSFCMNESV